MKDELDASETSEGQKRVKFFWLVLIAAVIFMVAGIFLADLFQAYTTAATL